MKKFISLWIKDKPLQAVWIAVTSLLGICWSLSSSNIYLIQASALLTPLVLLRLLVSLLLIEIGLIASVILLYNKNKEKLKPKFGIYWDKDKEPHCPACKGLLSDERPCDFTDGSKGTKLNCLKCNPDSIPRNYIFLKHNGFYITIKSARKLL